MTRLHDAFNLLAWPTLCQFYSLLRIDRAGRDEQYIELDYLA